MSITYRIDHDQGITFVLWEGVVTADDYLAHVQRLLADPDWPPARGQQLSDLRAASVNSLDEATLESAAALFGQHPKITTLKTALVAGDSFKHAVKFERFLSRYRPALIVFNSLDIACTWLGIDVYEAARTLRLLRGQARGRMKGESSRGAAGSEA